MIESLGYYLKEFDTGSTLDISMRERPTDKHFDPERLHFLGVRGNRLESVSLTHATNHSSLHNQRIGFGDISAIDRHDRTVRFFTFGASLDLNVSTDETLCHIVSTVPILFFTPDFNNLEAQLASETVGLMARIRSQYTSDDEWQKRLIASGPDSLYAGTLHSLFNHYAQTPPLQRMSPDFYRMLRASARTDAPSLEELFSK